MSRDSGSPGYLPRWLPSRRWPDHGHPVPADPSQPRGDGDDHLRRGDAIVQHADVDEVRIVAYLGDQSVQLEADVGANGTTALVELLGLRTAVAAPSRLESVPFWQPEW